MLDKEIEVYLKKMKQMMQEKVEYDVPKNIYVDEFFTLNQLQFVFQIQEKDQQIKMTQKREQKEEMKLEESKSSLVSFENPKTNSRTSSSESKSNINSNNSNLTFG